MRGLKGVLLVRIKTKLPIYPPPRGEFVFDPYQLKIFFIIINIYILSILLSTSNLIIIIISNSTLIIDTTST